MTFLFVKIFTIWFNQIWANYAYLEGVYPESDAKVVPGFDSYEMY